MNGRVLGSTPDQRKTMNRFHGLRASPEVIPKRKVTPISVSKDGDIYREPSSSRSQSQNGGRRPPTQRSNGIPKHPAQFMDTLQQDGFDAGSSRFEVVETARRTGSHSSKSKHPFLPTTSRRETFVDGTFQLKDDRPGRSAPRHGKAPAQDEPPRMTRSNSRRKASMDDVIHLDGDDDDDDIQILSPRESSSRRDSSSREIERIIKDMPTSSALERKAERTRREAEESVHRELRAAAPNMFYARTHRASGSGLRTQRPQGPIQLEEPNDRRRPNARSAILVADSPEPDVEVTPPSKPKRKAETKPRGKMVERMKAKPRSPVAQDATDHLPARGGASKIAPSPSSPPQPTRSSQEVGSSQNASGIKGTSGANKRARTDAGPSAIKESIDFEEQSGQPLKVPLKAIVISDIWRSRDTDNATVLFQKHAFTFGVDPDKMIKIQFSDLRKAHLSKQDVNECGVLCFSLKYGSDGAKLMQDKFRDFDPSASGGADEIYLIAQHSVPAELLAYKKAAQMVRASLERVLDKSHIHWLNEASAKTKVGTVDRVKQADWPKPSKTTPRRTLIFPGAGRLPDTQARRETPRSSFYDPPRASRTKTFDIQPASPKAAAPVSIDIDMTDAFASSKSPTLPSLKVPKQYKASPAPAPAPKVEIRRPRASSDGVILEYPFDRGMPLRGEDFDRLLDEGFLNDFNIEFGTTQIQEQIRKRDPALADSIHFFNTFFATVLRESSVEHSYPRLRRWVKGDLFSKKYIVIPVNENYHWYLAIIVNPGYLLSDHVKDSVSEQDKEEVASALAIPPKARTPPVALPEGVVDVVEPEQPREANAPGSSEPLTPPLPPLHLPLSSKASASLPAAIDVDGRSRGDTPPKAKAEPASLDHTFIITLDSLGQKHIKLSNKLYEYLWREAWDKKKPLASRTAFQSGDEKPKLTTAKESEQPGTPPTMVADPPAANTNGEQPSNQKTGGPKDSADESSEDGNDVGNGVRVLQVQDARRQPAHATSKSSEAEAWAKTLPKPVYISAQVPEQPNFCDCGVYLLHYIDRFFREPDDLLKLVVEAKNEITDVGKSGPSARQQVKDDVKRRVAAAWEAGEVSSKRAYWRTKLVELSEEWQAYKKAKKEGANQVETSKPKVDGDEQHEPNGASQQRPAQPTNGESDVLMADAQQENTADEVPGLDLCDMSSFERTLHAVERGNASIDDIERSVSDCVLGKDPVANRQDDEIIAQALAKGKASAYRGQSQEASNGDQEGGGPQDATAQWHFNFRETSPLHTASSVTETPDADTEPAAAKQTEADPVSPTLSASSAASPRLDRQQRQSQEEEPQQAPTTPPSFGASIMLRSPSSWFPSLPSFGRRNSRSRSRSGEASPEM